MTEPVARLRVLDYDSLSGTTKQGFNGPTVSSSLDKFYSIFQFIYNLVAKI